MSRPAIVVLAALLLPVPAAAQTLDLDGAPERVPTPFSFGGAFAVAAPAGEFGERVDNAGFGFAGHARARLVESGAAGLRLDGGFVVYGGESRDVCFSETVGCRIELDLTTSNTVAFLNAGPELVLPRGAVRPYVHAGLGLSYFSTTSSLRGLDRGQDRGDGDPFASTTNHDDLTFGLVGGGGLFVPFRLGGVPVAVDLGAAYLANGDARYLREGDIEELPGGEIRLNVQESEANLWLFRLGVSVRAVSSRGR